MERSKWKIRVDIAAKETDTLAVKGFCRSHCPQETEYIKKQAGKTGLKKLLKVSGDVLLLKHPSEAGTAAT